MKEIIFKYHKLTNIFSINLIKIIFINSSSNLIVNIKHIRYNKITNLLNLEILEKLAFLKNQFPESR